MKNEQEFLQALQNINFEDIAQETIEEDTDYTEILTLIFFKSSQILNHLNNIINK